MGVGVGSYIGEGYQNDFGVSVEVGKYTCIAKHLTILGSFGQHPLVNNPKAFQTFHLRNLDTARRRAVSARGL